MANVILYFLRGPEAKALLFLLLLILLLPLSAFFVPFISHSIWIACRPSNITIFIYIIAVCVYFITRWIACGDEFSGLDAKDLSGETYLITGSASGIGKQTALELAKHGAKVVLFVRPSNLQSAINDVHKVVGYTKRVTGYPIDLADLASIKSGIEQYKSKEGEDAPITALINNAGVMACPFSQTKDGFEMQMGTNHFGHFYLTQLLFPQLIKSKSRVVNVSSAAHAMWQVACTPDTYAQQLNQQTYKPWNAYALSKIANVYFTIELQRRFSSHGLRAYVLHPGAVDTDQQRHVDMAVWLIVPIQLLLFKTPLEGAQTNLFCAVSDEAVPGKYHADCREEKLGNPHADNPDRAREWWDYSEKVVAEAIKKHQH